MDAPAAWQYQLHGLLLYWLLIASSYIRCVDHAAFFYSEQWCFILPCLFIIYHCLSNQLSCLDRCTLWSIKDVQLLYWGWGFCWILLPFYATSIWNKICTGCAALVKKSPGCFLTFFPKQLGIFSPNFTHAYYMFLSMLDYKFLFIYLKLLMKLCHIMCDHPVYIICSKCSPSAETHNGWSHLIWHNFITVGDNWIKICNLA